ncbi:MAG: FRG domain-containing protein [Myxococcales bacterium]
MLVVAMNEVRVRSWCELTEELFRDSWNESLGRFRSPYAFRGTSSAAHRLETSLFRLGGDHRRVEIPLLRSFRKYAFRGGPHSDSIWYWLSLAQHHGLPTRVLDWSWSPYVALHFATSDLERYADDGAIWCVDFKKAHRLLPPRLRRKLAQEDATTFTVEMLRDVAPSLRELERLSRQEFVIFFEPPSLDERIVNQFALFSVLSNPARAFDEWLAGRPELYRRIVIAAELKPEARDKLDQANITERVLFPGLDGLSAWLRRHYSPSPVKRRARQPRGR